MIRHKASRSEEVDAPVPESLPVYMDAFLCMSANLRLLRYELRKKLDSADRKECRAREDLSRPISTNIFIVYVAAGTDGDDGLASLQRPEYHRWDLSLSETEA